MARMTSVVDVEARARRFVKERYPPRTVRQILFRRIGKEGDVWSMEEELWLKRLRLLMIKKSFRLQRSVGNGELKSHEEES